MNGAAERPAVDRKAQGHHVEFCFETLLARLGQRALPEPGFVDGYCPLFVTWNVQTKLGDSRMRGCIGTLEPKQLHKALRDYALISALQDQRFRPITASELPALSCTVSLLCQREPASTCYDWTVGVHGLIITFKDPVTGQQRAGTFLPEIAYHEGWDQQQTIKALLRKAGFHGQASPALLASLQTTRYQSTTASMTYVEFQARQGEKPDSSIAEVQPSLAVAVPA